MFKVPSPGDIVCHYLYTKSEWKAIVLRNNNLDGSDQMTYVHMLPGVQLAGLFFKKNKMPRGWIYTKWIWILGDENVKIT